MSSRSWPAATQRPALRPAQDLDDAGAPDAAARFVDGAQHERGRVDVGGRQRPRRGGVGQANDGRSADVAAPVGRHARRLVREVAEQGRATVRCLGVGRSAQAEPAGQRNGHVVWWLPGEPSTRCSRAGAASPRPLPHIAYRCRTAGMQRMLRPAARARRLGRHRVRRHLGRLGACPGARPLCRPQRPAAADLRLAQSRGEPAPARSPRASALFLRARPCGSTRSRCRAWSANWSTQVDFVTAITPEDLKLYRAPPRRQADGRADARLSRPTSSAERAISRRRAAPRRDRRQLRLDRQAHEPRGVRRRRRSAVRRGRRRAGQAVGSAEERFLERCAQRTMATPVHRHGARRHAATWTRRASPSCPSATAAASSSRCWSMSSTASRCSPCAARSPACRWSTTTASCSIPTTRPWRAACSTAIDDVDRLNRLQERAFAACRERFDWASRGRQIVSAIAS